MPIAEAGAIQSYASIKQGNDQHVTDKMKDTQLLAYKGGILFTEVMTESVLFDQKLSCQMQKVQRATWKSAIR